jgi:hypothetical protein
MGHYRPSGLEFQPTDGPNIKLPKELMTKGRDFREIHVVFLQRYNFLRVIAVTTFLKSLTTLYNLSSDYGGEG